MSSTTSNRSSRPSADSLLTSTRLPSESGGAAAFTGILILAAILTNVPLIVFVEGHRTFPTAILALASSSTFAATCCRVLPRIDRKALRLAYWYYRYLGPIRTEAGAPDTQSTKLAARNLTCGISTFVRGARILRSAAVHDEIELAFLADKWLKVLATYPEPGSGHQRVVFADGTVRSWAPNRLILVRNGQSEGVGQLSRADQAMTTATLGKIVATLSGNLAKSDQWHKLDTVKLLLDQPNDVVTLRALQAAHAHKLVEVHVTTAGLLRNWRYLYSTQTLSAAIGKTLLLRVTNAGTEWHKAGLAPITASASRRRAGTRLSVRVARMTGNIAIGDGNAIYGTLADPALEVVD